MSPRASRGAAPDDVAAAVAARLAGETTEASVTLPWRRLADLPWI